MAFEATHVRFARDVMPLLGIQNENAYYSGAVYPDSRYVTGIPRQQTHSKIPFRMDLSDFDKGQLTHMMYDRVVAKQYLAGTPWGNQPVLALDSAWEQLSGAKLAEDQISYDVLGEDVQILRELEIPDHPIQGEDMRALEQYYLELRKLYQQKPTMEMYYALLDVFHVPEPIAKQVILATTTCLQNTERLASINAIYPQGLTIATEELRQSLAV